MKIFILITALLSPSILLAARISGGGGGGNFISNSSNEQTGQFNVSSGTVRGKLMFSTVGTTYFEFDGAQVCLYVLGASQECWPSVVVASNLLLETGDALLLETGDNLLLE